MKNATRSRASAAPAPRAGGAEPAVSVVIPTRNRCEMLRDAVDSVRRQSRDDWELIVVDDASEDHTWEWLRDRQDPRLRPVRLERRAEQSATRNVGVRAAEAPIVLSFDDDDLLTPRALEAHLEALRRNPDAIASIGGYTVFDERGSRSRHRLVRWRTKRSVWEDVLFGWIAVIGQCAIRREALAAVGEWDESFIRATDHELWSRLALLGPVVLLPDIVLHYRVHAGQWRPTNLDELTTEARRLAVRRLDGERRRRGEEMLRLRELANEGFQCFLEADAGGALRRYLRVVGRAPRMLASPLTRPLVLRPMVRSLGGSLGIRVGRRVLDRLRQLSRRDPDFSVRARVDVAGRRFRRPSEPEGAQPRHDAGETP